MEAVLENSLEATNYLVDKHWDKGWDKYRKYVNGKKVEQSYRPTRPSKPDDTSPEEPPRPRSQSHSSSRSPPPPRRSSSLRYSDQRSGKRTPGGTSAPPPPSVLRSSAEFSGGAPLTAAVPVAAAAGATALPAPSSTASRRRQHRHRNQLPSPERPIERESRRDRIASLQQESEISDRVLRDYELETDDPKRSPESVLPEKDLRRLQKENEVRRDSGMSGYNDGYAQSQYAGESSRPRSQPPRSKYYDDDDSDYDERTGRRYRGGSGRGYEDDRDYDRVVEETERYRGPPTERPYERRESYRSGNDAPYGAGTVTQYGRRSDGALDRQEASYISRRSKSRGRDRDRSYSRSPSGSRSRSRSRDGIGGKLRDTFDTTPRGLGVGVAGAVIGGLAGREFGHKHRQRDIALGALIGGLGANFAENKWREWKDDKERDLKRDEDRLEQKWDGRDYGRSRSNVR